MTFSIPWGFTLGLPPPWFPFPSKILIEVLEPIFASRHDWARLIETYKIRRDANDDLELKSELTRKIARLYEEQLEDLDQAFEWYGKLFVEQPGEKKVRDILTRLAGIQEDRIQLALEKGSRLEIPLDVVREARLEVDWQAELHAGRRR